MRPLLRLMPEYSIPSVLHLLAHHPEYPDDDEPMDVEDGAQPGAPAMEDPGSRACSSACKCFSSPSRLRRAPMRATSPS